MIYLISCNLSGGISNAHFQCQWVTPPPTELPWFDHIILFTAHDLLCTFQRLCFTVHNFSLLFIISHSHFSFSIHHACDFLFMISCPHFRCPFLSPIPWSTKTMSFTIHDFLCTWPPKSHDSPQITKIWHQKSLAFVHRGLSCKRAMSCKMKY